MVAALAAVAVAAAAVAVLADAEAAGVAAGADFEGGSGIFVCKNCRVGVAKKEKKHLSDCRPLQLSNS